MNHVNILDIVIRELCERFNVHISFSPEMGLGRVKTFSAYSPKDDNIVLFKTTPEKFSAFVHDVMVVVKNIGEANIGTLKVDPYLNGGKLSTICINGGIPAETKPIYTYVEGVVNEILTGAFIGGIKSEPVPAHQMFVDGKPVTLPSNSRKGIMISAKGNRYPIPKRSY